MDNFKGILGVSEEEIRARIKLIPEAKRRLRARKDYVRQFSLAMGKRCEVKNG